ncbi:hypothetical protein E8E12_010730 [Didymella heteroderae]|uniref:Uncharacterized protein n=1 Tax=Didymella heteroderae TaxID=1769908 RepID=A0A9P4X0M9_9PLEO|nr:hypothetical protein E8E12_010730 [Didymella heteroderae]
MAEMNARYQAAMGPRDANGRPLNYVSPPMSEDEDEDYGLPRPRPARYSPPQSGSFSGMPPRCPGDRPEYNRRPDPASLYGDGGMPGYVGRPGCRSVYGGGDNGDELRGNPMDRLPGLMSQMDLGGRDPYGRHGLYSLRNPYDGRSMGPRPCSGGYGGNGGLGEYGGEDLYLTGGRGGRDCGWDRLHREFYDLN